MKRERLLKLSCREVIKLNEEGEEEVKSRAVKNTFGYVLNVMKNIKKTNVIYLVLFYGHDKAAQHIHLLKRLLFCPVLNLLLNKLNPKQNHSWAIIFLLLPFLLVFLPFPREHRRQYSSLQHLK